MSAQPIIIHQMQEIFSNTIQASLQKQGLTVFQTHHLGQASLLNDLHKYLDPVTSMAHVEREMAQFRAQLIATKLISNTECLQEECIQKERIKLITLARDPIDRWFGSLVDDYIFQLSSAKKFFLLETMKTPSDDLECFDFAIEKIFHIIENSPYLLGSDEFINYLDTEVQLRSEDSGQQLRLLGNELLAPFYLFRNNETFLDIDFFTGDPLKNYRLYESPQVHLLLLKFEFLINAPEESEQIILDFLKLKKFELCRTHIAKEKSEHKIMDLMKSKYYPQFAQLDAIKNSLYCQNFAY